MITLGQVAIGRDNNLNLIRMVAASAVLVSHAWPIALGPETIEPLRALTGHKLGSLSVWVFFAISGFLIAMSFERSPSRGRFVRARARRLLPALVVSVLAVAFVLGPIVTTLPVGIYVTEPATWSFIWRNIVLAVPQYMLPGVFADQPYTAVVGSIWTLFYEVLCYIGVFAVGVMGLLQRTRVMLGLIVLYLLGWLWIEAQPDVSPRIWAVQNLSLPFVIGTAFYVWRDRIVLHGVGVMALFVPVLLLHDTVFYDAVLALALSYGVFWLAYVPGGWIRGYNRIGDYSYGIYIYAFPLQGFAVWLMPGQGPWENIMLAAPMTLICAMASWHWVEQPALTPSPTAAQRRRG
mgnify:CR=1 FL=1